MRYFKKVLSVPVVILRECGRVHDHDILKGDGYAQYVPFYLYEVDENGAALPAPLTYTPAPEVLTTRKVEVTHVSYPTRPPPPPELQKAWEARKPVLTQAPALSLEDELARAASETVPLPSESPAIAADEAPPAESQVAANPATMVEQAPPKRKRGRPRKNPLPTP